MFQSSQRGQPLKSENVANFLRKGSLFQSSPRGQFLKSSKSTSRELLVLGGFNPLDEVIFKKAFHYSTYSKYIRCFNPLDEVIFKKEHLHFTIDFLGRQGAVLHTPATPSENKLLLCKLDRMNKIVKRPNR
jgi:hypothetical protein